MDMPVLHLFVFALAHGSIHLRASRDVIVEHEQVELLLALLGMHSGNQHAAGLNAHYTYTVHELCSIMPQSRHHAAGISSRSRKQLISCASTRSVVR